LNIANTASDMNFLDTTASETKTSNEYADFSDAEKSASSLSVKTSISDCDANIPKPDENEQNYQDALNLNTSRPLMVLDSDAIMAGLSLQMNRSNELGLSAPPSTWNDCRSDSFSLRIGPNYTKNRLKAPSPSSLMQLVGVDLVYSEARIDHFASKVRLPEAWTQMNTGNEKIPPVFIVNMQIPAENTLSLFSEITDGKGYSLVVYYSMKPETVAELNCLSTASNAVRLLAQYLSEAPEADKDPKSIWRGRFKMAMSCVNIDEFGLPSFITAYNAKPVLIRQTGTLIRGANYVEMDINVHRFASVAKKALQLCKDRFDSMILRLGFCIESKEDGEMPETLFGTVEFNRVIYGNAPVWRAPGSGSGI